MILKFDFMTCGPLIFGRIAYIDAILLSSMDVRSTFVVFFVPSPALPKTAARTWLSALPVWPKFGAVQSWLHQWVGLSRSDVEQIVNLDMSLWLVDLVCCLANKDLTINCFQHQDLKWGAAVTIAALLSSSDSPNCCHCWWAVDIRWAFGVGRWTLPCNWKCK